MDGVSPVGYGAMGRVVIKTRKERQSYSAAFKADAVRMVMTSGKSKEAVSRTLGVSHSALVRWVAEAKKGKQGEAVALAVNDSERIRELEEEVRELRLEREILKKAAAFFAKHQI
jgi:transposase